MKFQRPPFACLLAPFALLLLGACQTIPRNPEDQTSTDPLLSQVVLVDVAVLNPTVHTGSNAVLSSNIRDECRRVLLNKKHYAVPADSFVDKTLATRRVQPQQTAGLLGSDGVLAVTITDWDTADLLPRGRLYAAGEFVLYGNGKPLWRRSFKDKQLLSAGQVTAANRSQSEQDMVRSLVRDMLSALPHKRQR